MSSIRAFDDPVVIVGSTRKRANRPAFFAYNGHPFKLLIRSLTILAFP